MSAMPIYGKKCNLKNGFNWINIIILSSYDFNTYQPSTLSLNTIYLSLIAQKAHRRVLEGSDVGVLWLYVVEETVEPVENHRPWAGDNYPVTCRHRDSISSRSGGKRVR